MNCPHCDEPGGFHLSPCTSYLAIHWAHPELVGPGNSQAFMAWLKEKRKK